MLHDSSSSNLQLFRFGSILCPDVYINGEAVYWVFVSLKAGPESRLYPVYLHPQLDKSVINDVATGDAAAKNKSLIKFWCTVEKYKVTHQQAPHHVHELLVWRQ